MFLKSWQTLFAFWAGVAALIGLFWFGGSSPEQKQTKPAEQNLPALMADLSKTTVSGISSGAYMAGQFQMAHASIVTGAGIIAGGPYGCAQSVFSGVAPGPGAVFLSASRAVNGCMNDTLKIWGVPDPQALAKKARDLAASDRIDSIENLITDRVYLFSGTKDQTVKPRIVMTAAQYYRLLGIPETNIHLETTIDAGHGFVTLDKGGACSASRKPFVVDCDYDQAGALLAHLLGDLNPATQSLTGTFINFDQAPFAPGHNDGLSKTGVVYVPKACTQQEKCTVHIAFHGCNQNRASVGSAFVKDSGYARWADTNRLIVLFPQASSGTLNPTGCWDWWGYTGNDYLTRKAPQIKAVRAMLDRLASSPEPVPEPGT